jgi:hypothetical protein
MYIIFVSLFISNTNYRVKIILRLIVYVETVLRSIFPIFQTNVAVPLPE